MFPDLTLTVTKAWGEPGNEATNIHEISFEHTFSAHYESILMSHWNEQSSLPSLFVACYIPVTQPSLEN